VAVGPNFKRVYEYCYATNILQEVRGVPPYKKQGSQEPLRPLEATDSSVKIFYDYGSNKFKLIWELPIPIEETVSYAQFFNLHQLNLIRMVGKVENRIIDLLDLNAPQLPQIILSERGTANYVFSDKNLTILLRSHRVKGKIEQGIVSRVLECKGCKTPFKCRYNLFLDTFEFETPVTSHNCVDQTHYVLCEWTKQMLWYRVRSGTIASYKQFFDVGTAFLSRYEDAMLLQSWNETTLQNDGKINRFRAKFDKIKAFNDEFDNIDRIFKL
jgi:hypothetical protein